MPPSSLPRSRLPAPLATPRVRSLRLETPDIDLGIDEAPDRTLVRLPSGTSTAERTTARSGALPFLLATGAMLGLSTALAKLAAAAGLVPLAFLAWSCGGAGALSLARSALRGTLPPLSARTAEYFLCSALLTVAAPNLILFSAVAQVGAAFVATTIALPALFTYVGALALGLERFRVLRIAGVVLALGGTACIALLEIALPEAPAGWIAFTLVAPVLFACGNLYRTLRWPPGLAAETLTPGMLAAAAAMLFAASLAPLPDASVALPLDRTLALVLVGAQTLVFAAQFRFLLELQRRGGPVYLSLIGPIGALVGVAVAVLLLGESAPRGLGAGAVAIGLGIALLSRRGGRRRRRRRSNITTAAGTPHRGARRRRRRSTRSLGTILGRGGSRWRWRSRARSTDGRSSVHDARKDAAG